MSAQRNALGHSWTSDKSRVEIDLSFECVPILSVQTNSGVKQEEARKSNNPDVDVLSPDQQKSRPGLLGMPFLPPFLPFLTLSTSLCVHSHVVLDLLFCSPTMQRAGFVFHRLLEWHWQPPRQEISFTLHLKKGNSKISVLRFGLQRSVNSDVIFSPTQKWQVT